MPKAQVTPDRVVQALMKRPELFYRVKGIMLYKLGAGPWVNIGKASSQALWGLRRYPSTKDGHDKVVAEADPEKLKWVATIRPTDESSENQAHPGKWYWNVDTGNPDLHGNGIVDTMIDAANAAAAHLRGHGWVVLNEFHDDVSTPTRG